MNLSILLTCHNRQAKTETCLRSLKDALEAYNKNNAEKVHIEIFLTDDGCTDGTAEAARVVFPNEQILHILRGDGNLYWAGGMRFCWKEAMKRHSEWDYYLLLNDDVQLYSNLFEELFNALNYSRKKYNQEGVISGITCSFDDPKKMTYGGDVFVNRFLGTSCRLEPIGEPQLCDKTNANILLVPSTVVDKIGIFYKGYRHSHADTDYSMLARRKGIPVVLTAHFCGSCDQDNTDARVLADKVMSMPLKDRVAYFRHPLHSTREYLLEICRTAPLRLPLVWFGRMLNTYFPKLYYSINGLR